MNAEKDLMIESDDHDVESSNRIAVTDVVRNISSPKAKTTKEKAAEVTRLAVGEEDDE